MKDGRIKPKFGDEWSKKNKYNSFNSDKGLTYLDSHYKPIINWFEGKGELPAPIELSLDPSHLCNFKCGHCNAQRYLTINPEEVPKEMRKMSKKHLENLIDFCSDWGVGGVCIGGGGEPLMNKNVWDLPSYIAKKNMKSSFATNGSLINEQIANEMMNCRWVGVSVDSGTKETFERVHGVDYFDRVINNLKLLVKTKEKTGSDIDISYKFLINPHNWEDLEQACKIASDIGVKDFHARPVDLERKDFTQAVKLNYNMDSIEEIFSKCRQMERGEEYRVFTVVHKYDPEFKVKHTFNNCVSSSLMLQACADGNSYVCADHRIENRFKLSEHYPNPKKILEFWGSDQHRDLLKGIHVDKECARCTYGVYAEQIERLVSGSYGKDPMCLDFP